MKKIDIIKALKTPEALHFVKQRLTQIQELPKLGVIGGQAVSSAVLEYLNLTNVLTPVYGDIDIFTLLSHEYYRRESFNKDNDFIQAIKRMVDKKDSSTSTFSDRGIHETPYGEIFNYSARTEKVLTSYADGELNRTILLTNSSILTLQGSSVGYGSRVIKIISNFDINSTQIGFDAGMGKELEFTSAFVDFIYTKELRIAKFNTPMQSLIRLHKKVKELGAVSDLEKQAFLCASQIKFIEQQKLLETDIQFCYDDNNQEKGNELSYLHTLSLPLMFGIKHKNTFEEYGLDKLYTLNTARGFEEKDGLYSLSIPSPLTFVDRFASLGASSIHSTNDIEVANLAFNGQYEELLERGSLCTNNLDYGISILNDIVADYVPIERISDTEKSLSTIAQLTSEFKENIPFMNGSTSLIDLFESETIDSISRMNLSMKKITMFPFAKSAINRIFNLGKNYDDISFIMDTISSMPINSKEDEEKRERLLFFISFSSDSTPLLRSVCDNPSSNDSLLGSLHEGAYAYFHKEKRKAIISGKGLRELTTLSEIYSFCNDIKSPLFGNFTYSSTEARFVLIEKTNVVICIHAPERSNYTTFDSRRVIPNELASIYLSTGKKAPTLKIKDYIDYLYAIDKSVRILPLADTFQVTLLFSFTEVEKFKYTRKAEYRFLYRIEKGIRNFSFAKTWRSLGLPVYEITFKIKRVKTGSGLSIADSDEIPF